MSVIMMMLCGYAMGYEVSPRISDREIVERLTRLEEGQRALNKRIDEVNKSIEEVNKRIKSRVEDLNWRIEEMY